jgi:hypothetical protein
VGRVWAREMMEEKEKGLRPGSGERSLSARESWRSNKARRDDGAGRAHHNVRGRRLVGVPESCFLSVPGQAGRRGKKRKRGQSSGQSVQGCQSGEPGQCAHVPEVCVAQCTQVPMYRSTFCPKKKIESRPRYLSASKPDRGKRAFLAANLWRQAATYLLM